jgi:hypothetical protein
MPLVAENHEVRAHLRNETHNRVSGTSRTQFAGEGDVMLACDCFSAGLHPFEVPVSLASDLVDLGARDDGFMHVRGVPALVFSQ